MKTAKAKPAAQAPKPSAQFYLAEILDLLEYTEAVSDLLMDVSEEKYDAPAATEQQRKQIELLVEKLDQEICTLMETVKRAVQEHPEKAAGGQR
jgi:hypothetical protein